MLFIVRIVIKYLIMCFSIDNLNADFIFGVGIKILVIHNEGWKYVTILLHIATNCDRSYCITYLLAKITLYNNRTP